MENKRNAMEERLNSTKPLDDLKEQESHLKQLNEDEVIIQDKHAASYDKETAQEQIEARNEELVRLQTQVEEREVAQPLQERIKEIFKKNGVTLAAIVLATGVTIGTVVGAITNVLKATSKAIGNVVKEVGTKVGSILPGLIGSIASFLFKTAGQVISNLAEHTWLLILAGVIFVTEKHLKKQH